MSTAGGAPPLPPRELKRQTSDRSVASAGGSDLRTVLEFMERRTAPDDRLGLGESRAALAALRKGGAEEGEAVRLSCKVVKVNRKKKRQQRTLVLTDAALYNLAETRFPFAGFDCKRRIPLEALRKVTVSDLGEDFVVHVAPSEGYDYFFSSPDRRFILRRVGDLVRARTGEELRADVASTEGIASVVTTRTLRERQTNASGGGGGAADPLLRKVRGMVSKKKKRFREDGYDLDLTYVTSRLVAMGYPSEDVESYYRNPYGEVFRLVESRHSGHYRVYNLCSEEQYQYDAAKWNGALCAYPFDDHNVPPVQMMVAFCEDVGRFLAEDARNVVLVHCKAGKGRTGTMLSAYLLWSGACASAEEALDFFGRQRTDNGKGVTIPSQRRYVHYFERYLRHHLAPQRPLFRPARFLVLARVAFGTAPAVACAPYFKLIGLDGAKLFDSRQLVPPSRVLPEAEAPSFPCSARLCGDVKVVFYAHGDKKLCWCWFNTSFVDEHRLRLDKFEIDKAHKDKDHAVLPPDFSLEFVFRDDDIVYDLTGAVHQAAAGMLFERDSTATTPAAAAAAAAASLAVPAADAVTEAELAAASGDPAELAGLCARLQGQVVALREELARAGGGASLGGGGGEGSGAYGLSRSASGVSLRADDLVVVTEEVGTSGGGGGGGVEPGSDGTTRLHAADLSPRASPAGHRVSLSVSRSHRGSVSVSASSGADLAATAAAATAVAAVEGGSELVVGEVDDSDDSEEEDDDSLTDDDAGFVW